MVGIHPLYTKYQKLTHDRDIDAEDYAAQEKRILREALMGLKEDQHADLDCIVGTIGVNHGDAYNITTKTALSHLARALKGGSRDAGMTLAAALRGQIAAVPDEALNSAKALEILTSLANARHVPAHYELSSFYLDQVLAAQQAGEDVPQEWYDLCYKNAQLSADAKQCSGYNMLGNLHLTGFGPNVKQNLREAFLRFEDSINMYTKTMEEEPFLADSKFNLGLYYYDALAGTQRDRIKGLGLITDAADLGHAYAAEWIEENNTKLGKEGLMIGASADILGEN